MTFEKAEVAEFLIKSVQKTKIQGRFVDLRAPDPKPSGKPRDGPSGDKPKPATIPMYSTKVSSSSEQLSQDSNNKRRNDGKGDRERKRRSRSRDRDRRPHNAGGQKKDSKEATRQRSVSV